jgi:RimJ/RimL family protein N-acetyltransferase
LFDIVWAGSRDPTLNKAMADWAARHIWGGSQTFGNCVCMGVMENGSPIACIVYHNWNPLAEIIEFSGASIDSRWLTRPVLKAMFDYPFIDLKCQMVITRNSAGNTRLHRQLTSYGLKRHLIPRGRGRFEDEVVFTLTDDDWRSNKFNRGRFNEQA